jgi:hypothetical protein
MSVDGADLGAAGFFATGGTIGITFSSKVSVGRADFK